MSAVLPKWSASLEADAFLEKKEKKKGGGGGGGDILLG